MANSRTSSEQLADRLPLYFVVGADDSSSSLLELVHLALAGGVTSVQLRAKNTNDRETTELARRLRPVCRSAEALFFVNDRVDIALAAGADGVHLGVDDLPIEDARHIAGDDLLIGYSPETDEQAASAASRGADYLGVGPVFATSTKGDAGPAIGLDVLARRVEQAGIPVIGIGGIDASNAGSVIRTGAAGVAVVSAIRRAADPESAATALSLAVRNAMSYRCPHRS